MYSGHELREILDYFRKSFCLVRVYVVIIQFQLTVKYFEKQRQSGNLFLTALGEISQYLIVDVIFFDLSFVGLFSQL
jgi:hypothetical protein